MFRPFIVDPAVIQQAPAGGNGFPMEPWITTGVLLGFSGQETKKPVH